MKMSTNTENNGHCPTSKMCVLCTNFFTLTEQRYLYVRAHRKHRNVPEMLRRLGYDVDEFGNLNYENITCPDCYQVLDNSADFQNRANAEEIRNQELRQQLEESTKRLESLKDRVELDITQLANWMNEGMPELVPTGNLQKFRDGVWTLTRKWTDLTVQPDRRCRVQGGQEIDGTVILQNIKQEVNETEILQNIKQEIISSPENSECQFPTPQETQPNVASLFGQQTNPPGNSRKRTYSNILNRYSDDKLHQTVKVMVQNLNIVEMNQMLKELQIKTRVVYFGDTSDSDEEIEEDSTDESDHIPIDPFIQEIHHDDRLSKWQIKVVCGLYSEQKLKEKDPKKWQLRFDIKKRRLTYRDVLIRMDNKTKSLACGGCRNFTGCNPTNFWEEIPEHVKSAHKNEDSSWGNYLRKRPTKPTNSKCKKWNPSWEEDVEQSDEGIGMGKRRKNQPKKRQSCKRVKRPLRKRSTLPTSPSSSSGSSTLYEPVRKKK